MGYVVDSLVVSCFVEAFEILVLACRYIVDVAMCPLRCLGTMCNLDMGGLWARICILVVAHVLGVAECLCLCDLGVKGVWVVQKWLESLWLISSLDIQLSMYENLCLAISLPRRSLLTFGCRCRMMLSCVLVKTPFRQ